MNPEWIIFNQSLALSNEVVLKGFSPGSQKSLFSDPPVGAHMQSGVMSDRDFLVSL